ncbi:hypothetical protein [Pseudanabaena cinerea]|nr:hypothetical protein [Pseudanabaena cinerea]
MKAIKGKVIEIICAALRFWQDMIDGELNELSFLYSMTIFA